MSRAQGEQSNGLNQTPKSKRTADVLSPPNEGGLKKKQNG